MHQSRFPGTGNARNHIEGIESEIDINALEIVY